MANVCLSQSSVKFNGSPTLTRQKRHYNKNPTTFSHFGHAQFINKNNCTFHTRHIGIPADVRRDGRKKIRISVSSSDPTRSLMITINVFGLLMYDTLCKNSKELRALHHIWHFRGKQRANLHTQFIKFSLRRLISRTMER